MNNFRKNVELAANVAILVVAVLLCAVLLKSQFAGSPPPDVAAAPRPGADRAVRAGEKLDVPGVDWQKNGQTLLLALSTTCHFCTESAPFYRRLKREGENTRLLAVFPQSAAEGEAYLRKLDVPAD